MENFYRLNELATFPSNLAIYNTLPKHLALKKGEPKKITIANGSFKVKATDNLKS